MQFQSRINGHLDIIVTDNASGGEEMHWKEVLIHGDPEGLRSFAKLLLELADLDQDSVMSLPTGAREHVHLRPDLELSHSSEQVIVGRLDAKGTGEFYGRYAPKPNPV